MSRSYVFAIASTDPRAHTHAHTHTNPHTQTHTDTHTHVYSIILPECAKHSGRL